MYHFGISSLEFKSVSETAAYFHLTEKYLKIIEVVAFKTIRGGIEELFQNEREKTEIFIRSAIRSTPKNVGKTAHTYAAVLAKRSM